jgi:4-hydroxy-tetrahydrodipicolinate synthase
LASHSLPKPLRGIVTPLLTPLASSDTLDVEGLSRLLDHVIAGGVHGVFVLGTSGEGPALSLRLQKQVIEITCARVAGRIPVLAGVTGSSFADSIDLCRHSENAGASAVVTAGPLYFPVTQDHLDVFIRRFSEASPLPVFLYNMPSHAHVRFEIPTVLRAAGLPNVAGLKDSAGDIIYLHQLRRALAAHPEFTLLVGPEEMMAECVLLGIHGGVNGGSNLFPKLYVDLYNAASSGDLATARELQARVIDISARLYQVSYGAGYLQGAKCAANLLGLGHDAFAAPYTPFDGEQRETIRRQLVELGFL